MNFFLLVIKNISHKPLNSFLCILLVALGVGIISLLSHAQIQISDTLSKTAQRTDIVVGAKGSPLQLILSAIFHVDSPTGNIPLKEAQKLSKNPLVEQTIPLSYGDNYGGYRIVGTEYPYLDLYEATIMKGELWSKAFDAVIGLEVAKQLNLKVGDSFASAHGLMEGGEAHDEHMYKVTGILNRSNSVVDRLILTSLESIWQAHDGHSDPESDSEENEEDHHDHDQNEEHQSTHQAESHGHRHEEDKAITALLVSVRNPLGLMQIPQQINENTQMQAAFPTFKVNRLLKLSESAVQMIKLIAYLIITVAGISVFISLYNNLKDRKEEMALMRIYGAKRLQLGGILLLEALLLVLVGFICGLLISRMGLLFINFYLGSAFSSTRSTVSLIILQEVWLLLIAIIIAIIAAIIPAFNAFNLNISKTLKNG
ncbi:hypothetical protein C9994_09030 [Marivirga lumbricoides]|uniref:Uncharacterized protein n=1 Tax=Marivirga lumbricoides TaxID=1046115 RepID=A0A2T4DQH6_9BACT|nr:hypothetical protein C9994_09030 [Marivirga lumbricoides]